MESHSDEDSNEWEWETLSDESCQDKGIDVIRPYASTKHKGLMMESTSNHTSSSSQVIQNDVPSIDIEVNQWVGEPYVPSWRPTMEESNARFNPHEFYPTETIVESSEEDFDRSLEHLEEAHV